ncbi:MAG: hypothetical protein ABUT20_59070, partial [Bacteroidota bacterium]
MINMQIFRLRSLEDYKRHVELNRKNYDIMKQQEDSLTRKGKKVFTVRGISYPANEYVDFKADYLYSDGININWRERLVCPVTGLNNRVRSCIHILDLELTPYPDSVIYVTEQVTPLFTFLQKKFQNLLGSEYLGDDKMPGSLHNDIRHEDMTKLSFATESLDYYLSFECFEH